MKKQIILLLVFIFSIIITDQAGSNFFARTTVNGAFSSMGKDAISSNIFSPLSPESVGMSSVTLARIESIVKDGIEARAFPGCQVFVMKDGKLIYDKCFGYYTYAAIQKVTPTTIYDLASLSKTTGTLLAIMKLYDNGKLKLTDKASLYLPFLRCTDKENITITELLFHESGLPADLSCYRLATTKDPSMLFIWVVPTLNTKKTGCQIFLRLNIPRRCRTASIYRISSIRQPCK